MIFCISASGFLPKPRSARSCNSFLRVSGSLQIRRRSSSSLKNSGKAPNRVSRNCAAVFVDFVVDLFRQLEDRDLVHRMAAGDHQPEWYHRGYGPCICIAAAIVGWGYLRRRAVVGDDRAPHDRLLHHWCKLRTDRQRRCGPKSSRTVEYPFRTTVESSAEAVRRVATNAQSGDVSDSCCCPPICRPIMASHLKAYATRILHLSHAGTASFSTQSPMTRRWSGGCSHIRQDIGYWDSQPQIAAASQLTVVAL